MLVQVYAVEALMCVDFCWSKRILLRRLCGRLYVQGINTLKGAADLGVTHVLDVVEAHKRSMVMDSASGRYLVSPDMIKLEQLFETLKALYPNMSIASMTNMDIASGTPGMARKVEASRTLQELDMQFRPAECSLKDAVDSMLARNLIAVPSAA